MVLHTVYSVDLGRYKTGEKGCCRLYNYAVDLGRNTQEGNAAIDYNYAVDLDRNTQEGNVAIDYNYAVDLDRYTTGEKWCCRLSIQ